MQLSNVRDVVMVDNEIVIAIDVAFSHRTTPCEVIKPGAPKTDEYQDASAFLGKNWRTLRCHDFELYPAAVSGFSPEAFCYYLPGILTSSLVEMRPDLDAGSALIYMLDRGNGPVSWDEFFIERWCSLNEEECRAVQQWVLWLAEKDPGGFISTALDRAFDTLEILANRKQATPLALFSG